MRPMIKIPLILGAVACVVGFAAYGVFLALSEADSAEQTHIKGAVKAALALLKAMPAVAPLPIVPKPVRSPEQPQEAIARNARKFGGDISELRTDLSAAIANFEAGTGSEREVLRILYSIDRPYEATLPALNAWIATGEAAYAAHIARARVYQRLGWHARGSDYVVYTHDDNFIAARKWDKLAVDDYVTALPKSKYPVVAVASLLNYAIQREIPDAREPLYKAGERIFPASEAMFHAYERGLFSEWGTGSIPAAQAFLVRATKNRVPEDVRESLTQRLANIYANNYNIREYQGELAYTIEQTKQKDNAETWFARAKQERRATLLDAALLSTQRALKHEPAHARALSEQAYILFALKRPDEAKAARRLAADLGNNWAQEQIIDDLIFERNGETRDWIKIRAECEASAAMLNTAGQTCMGGMITDGVGGFTRDNAKEIAWYELAAHQGDSKSQYNYGWMLYQGMGTKQDQEKGLFYLRNSARQGFDMALKKLIQLGERTDNLEWKASDWENFTRWVRRMKDKGIN